MTKLPVIVTRPRTRHVMPFGNIPKTGDALVRAITTSLRHLPYDGLISRYTMSESALSKSFLQGSLFCRDRRHPFPDPSLLFSLSTFHLFAYTSRSCSTQQNLHQCSSAQTAPTFLYTMMPTRRSKAALCGSFTPQHPPLQF